MSAQQYALAVSQVPIALKIPAWAAAGLTSASEPAVSIMALTLIVMGIDLLLFDRVAKWRRCWVAAG